MSTLAEFMIVVGANNRPPMLDKPQYESWKSHMELYIQEDGTVRLKTYEELSDKEKLQADCDLKAINIVLQGLPPDFYALVNHHKISKDVWDRVKLLMQGTSLLRQERECKLYDEFDKFSHVIGETLYQYYLRLPPEWGKFMTDVKLARDLHTFPDPLALVTNYHPQPSHFNNYHSQYTTPQYQQQLSPPLQHIHTQPSVPQNAYPTLIIPQQPQVEFPQLDSGLEVPTFLPSDDPIACMNKAMAFFSAVFTPRYPSTNNQLISSSNLRNQAIVQGGSRGNISGQTKVVKCYNCQCEGHMARQCTQPKRKRDATWFKEKVLLIQAQAEGKELDEEPLAFLADPGVADGQVAQTITHNATFQTDDLDAYDSDCDDISSAKAVLMANLSSCDSDGLSETDTLKQTLSKHVKEKESLLTTLNGFKMEFKERESKSIDKEIVLENINKKLENIVSQRIKPILYDGNVLSKTHDVLSVADDEENLILAKEIRLKMVEKQNDTIMKKEKINITPINYYELNKLAKNFEKRFVPQQELSADQKFWLQSSARTLKNLLQAKDTVISKLKETIHSLRKNVNPAKVKKDIDETETINIELEHSVAKLLSENEKLHKEKEHLKKTYKELYDSIKPSRVHAKEQSLKNEFRKLKGKTIIDTVVSKPYATTIASGMFKLDLEPLASKVLKNKDAHLDYIKHSRIQEVLVYVRDTCPCLTRPSEKLVAITPKNKDKKVRFAKPITSSSNTQKQVDSHKQKDSNQPLFHSTRVIGSTGASGSKPTGKTQNNRISQSSSSNKTNKVEDQSRSVKSRKNKKNRVAKIECNAYVMQSMLNANSKSVYVVQIVLSYLDFGCSKHMTGNRSQLTNFINKFLGTVKFGNDQIAKIMGYGNYQIRNVTISRVYYVEGLGHNLFSVGQFCDSNLEVAFRKHTCFVRNLEGVALLMGSRETNLYTLSIGDMMKSSPICLLSKASKTKSWLWHRRLSHLKFGTINQLAKQGLVRGLPKLKFEKDHLCSACSLGKSKKQSHKPKSEDTNQEKLYLLHMDLCRSKDEASELIIKFLKMIKVCLNETVKNIRTYNGTEFVNQTMRSYCKDVGISHEIFVERTPQQNVVTACYTQNRSLIRLRHGKTPYELLHDRKSDLSYLHVFGALCYPTNDSKDLGKLKAKADVGIFIGYAPAKKAYRIYNRRTRQIMETIHVDFDELTAMASKQSSSETALNEITPGTLTRVDHPVPKVAAPVLIVSTGTSSSISIDQDAPSPSTSQTLQESPSHVIPPGAEEADHDIEVAHMDNNP
ncbi:retrovirus-related pol polyprotein from transposon TNT 1-94 [Tanacetum coccineum]